MRNIYTNRLSSNKYLAGDSGMDNEVEVSGDQVAVYKQSDVIPDCVKGLIGRHSFMEGSGFKVSKKDMFNNLHTWNSRGEKVNLVNKELSIVGVCCNIISRVEGDTMKLDIYCSDGSYVSTSAYTLIKSFISLFNVMGYPETWDEELKVRIVTNKSNNKTYYNLKVI